MKLGKEAGGAGGLDKKGCSEPGTHCTLPSR